MDGPYHYTFFHEGEKNNNQFNQVIFFKQVQIGALVSSDHDINCFFSCSDQIHYSQELLLCARAYFRTTVCQTVSAITISTFYLLLDSAFFNQSQNSRLVKTQRLFCDWLKQWLNSFATVIQMYARTYDGQKFSAYMSSNTAVHCAWFVVVQKNLKPQMYCVENI